MGRGRQKAKQTKVARELKYHSASIDVTALQRELSGGHDEPGHGPGLRDAADDDEDDSYAGYGPEDDDETSDYASQSRSR